MLLLIALAGPAFAADQPVTPPPPEVTAIVGGDVWTVTRGVIQGGTVILKGAKIDKVGGTGMPIPEGARRVDATGKVVAPGFVAALAHLGVSAWSGASGAKVKDSLDPFCLPVSLALASGVTTMCAMPQPWPRSQPLPSGLSRPAGILAARNAVVKAAEGGLSEMLLRDPGFATFPEADPGGNGPSLWWGFREQLRKAKEYQAKFEQYEAEKKAGKTPEEPKKPGDLDTALALVRRERTLLIQAARGADILRALKLADDYGIRVALAGATEAWLVPGEIARHNVPVLLDVRSRARPDERKNGPSGANPDAPGILRKAGVRVAVMPRDTAFGVGGMMGRDLMTYPMEAALAMRGGLDAQSALEAITLVPAQILDVADRVGSIEEGKDADVLILSGDPLDYRTFVEKAFVNGRLLYQKEKSTFFAHVRQP